MHYDCDYWIVVWSNKDRQRHIMCFSQSQLDDNQKRDLYLSSGFFLSDIGAGGNLSVEVEEALLRANRLLSNTFSESVTTWSTSVKKGTVRIVTTGVKR